MPVESSSSSSSSSSSLSASKVSKEERQAALNAVQNDWCNLLVISEPLLEDKDIIMAAIRQSHLAFGYASPKLHADKQFIFDVLSMTESRFVGNSSNSSRAFVYVSDELKRDKSFVKQVVSRYPSTLQFMHNTLKDDTEIVLEAVTKDASALLFASPRLRNNKEFLLEVLNRNDSAFKYMSEPFKADKDIAYEAFLRDENSFANASSEAHSNKDLVLKVVARQPFALQYASKNLRNDKNVVKTAVEENVHSLRYASHALRSNKKFLRSLKGNANYYIVLSYASTVLKNDKDFVLEFIAENYTAMIHTSEGLKADREFILRAVQQNGRALSQNYLPYQDDAEIITSAVSQHGEMLCYASKTLRADKEIVLTAVANKGTALQFASNELKADRDIVLAAVYQDARAFEFADATLRGDKDVVLKAVAQNADMLKFALNGLNQDRDCWIAAGLWREKHNQKLKIQQYPPSAPVEMATDASSSGSTSDESLLSRVVLSTKFSLHGESTSSATTFTKELSDHEFFKNGPYTIYSPNAFGKSTCDPKWTNIDWPCRGTYSTCEKEARLKTGTPTLDCCWRYSFRWHLLGAMLSRGFMIQVVDLEGQPRIYEASKSQYALGDGQNIETLMAKEAGTKIFRVYRPRRLNGRGGQYLLNFERKHIDVLVGKIEEWRNNYFDMSECELDFTESE